MLTAEQPRTPPVPSAEHSTPIQTPSTPATTPKRETEPIKEIQPVERPRKRVKIAAAEDIPENGAYAKLQGRDLDSGDFFEAYVTELPTILGRAHKGQPSKGFVSLGGCKQISKFHAKIDFEYKKSYFFIEPTGKNSITVRKVQHQCDPNYIKSNSKKQPEEKTSKVTSNDGDKSTEKHGDSSNAGLDNSHVESKEPKETKEPDSKADAEEVKRGKGSGAPVNGKGPRATGKRIKINSKDPIRIGNIGFYFLKSLK